MNRRQNALGTLMVILLVAILLVVLNPKQEDFRAYLGEHRAAASTNADNPIGKLVQGAAKGLGQLEARAYKSTNYLICSTFMAPGENGAVYLGIAKLFIRLK